MLLDVISETTEMFVGLASFLYVWFQTRMLSYGKLRKAFAKKVFLDHDHLTVMITDGRNLSVPLIWIPRLHKATEAERNNLRLLEGGVILHWPDLETKIRVEQLISGVVSIENRPLLNQWGKDGHH